MGMLRREKEGLASEDTEKSMRNRKPRLLAYAATKFNLPASDA
jgi:hypothetical protein